MATTPTLREAPAALPVRSRHAERAIPTLFPPVPEPGDTSRHPGEASTPPRAATPSRKPAAGLVGIARLAANSPKAEEKRGTEYFLLPVKSILNRCDSTRVPFEWTVNPYRGCEFGCRYCYARYTHEYMELDGGEFEKKIFVKQHAGELASRDLNEHFGIQAMGMGVPADEHIAVGTATDPYQPAEREFGATRAILEQMAEREGLSLSITTKSDQVVRDIELLKRIAARSSLSINMSVTTVRPRLARLLEPRAPRPDLRLAAVRKLREAGLDAGVFAMPVLPGITDHQADLEAVARAAKDAGALWFAANVVFLMPASMKQWLPFLEEKFPKLVKQYQEWYRRTGYAPESYQQEVFERVRALRKKYGFNDRPYAPGDVARAMRASPQLALNLEVPANGTRRHQPAREGTLELAERKWGHGTIAQAGEPDRSVKNDGSRIAAVRSCACG